MSQAPAGKGRCYCLLNTGGARSGRGTVPRDGAAEVAFARTSPTQGGCFFLMKSGREQSKAQNLL